LIRTTNFDEYLIDDILRDLIDLNFINQKKITNTSYIYNITELGKEFINGKKGNNGNLAEAKETFVDSLSSAADGGIYKNAVKEFIDNNSDAFKIMGKEDPDLYTAILSGLSFVLGQQTIKDANLEPFKPLENQQQLEDDVILNDLISDDDLGDLDLDDLDLQEIDLSGLQEDIEINEDELGDLSDFDELKDFVENEIQNALEVKLLPSQFNVLKVLYDYYKKFPVANEMNSDSIRRVLEKDNIIYSQNQILKYLEQLSDFEFVLQNNDFKGNISWIITPDGVDYVENKTKINKGQSQVAITTSPTDIMLKKRQEKAQKTGDGLDYDYYLIANILNNDTGLVTAGTVTTILQQQFKKNPKWDETEILLKLRVLTSLGMALLDIQNSVEYFEISEFGEDVVKYLIEQENKGLYPNARKLFESKPTQQKVALRPSPTESATLNPIGTIKQGNDGNNWQVRENKSGVKRWVKL
jgi:predicted transcriptional regulator